MAKPDSRNRAYPPRGMRREAAAAYIGLGVTKFDELVADGRMPKPKRVDGCVIWDRFQLEAAFTDLPDDKPANPLDRMFEPTKQENPWDRVR
jgi:predicted DNA-binding transcriptional regulator AlpA